MTGPYRRWCISGRRLLFGKCHILPLSSLVFAIRKTRKVDSRKKKKPPSLSDPITAHTMFALETPRRGFCQSVAPRMLSHGQFRISLCLGLDGVPGVCSVSGIQAGKSVHSGRLGTAGCPRSAHVLGGSEHTGAVPQGGKSSTALQGDTAELSGSFGLIHAHYKSSSACLFTIVCLSLMFLR